MSILNDTRYASIAEYAIIGDCHGTALVRRSGAIDWACLDRFDSGSIFCRLLDADKGGTFCFVPHDLESVHRRYLPDTNVLETTFVTCTGRARLLDCFAMRRGGRKRPLRQLLRCLEGIEGRVTLEVTIAPRFDYGSLHPFLRSDGRERVHSAVGGNDAFVLSTDCPLVIDQGAGAWRGEMTLRPGQRLRFTITAAPPFALELSRVSANRFDRRLRSTIKWWQSWVRRAQSTEPLPPEVVRSALTLKLLTFAPSGAIVAAPTTSLPEAIGGSLNWDYRYSWVRDSTMTLSALLSTGHTAAAARFQVFIQRATAGRAEELQVVYGCFGERRLPEVSLDHLEGYAGSRPVRVGNRAMEQTQLDVYGELLDGAFLGLQHGVHFDDDTWRFLCDVVRLAAARWREPDQGLWEMRGEAHHFVYSKVMCWVALSRGIQIAEQFQMPCELERWRICRDEIRSSIEQHGIDPQRGCFVQTYGSRELDASLLRLPIVGFVRADDPRMSATVDAILEDLAEGPLIRRYRRDRIQDGLGENEGAFLTASFWLVDVLSMAGRLDEAERLYCELRHLQNDVGLLSEECDFRSRQPLGNFPQAFTHVALIEAAEQLRRARGGEDASRSLSNRRHPSTSSGKS